MAWSHAWCTHASAVKSGSHRYIVGGQGPPEVHRKCARRICSTLKTTSCDAHRTFLCGKLCIRLVTAASQWLLDSWTPCINSKEIPTYPGLQPLCRRRSVAPVSDRCDLGWVRFHPLRYIPAPAAHLELIETFFILSLIGLRVPHVLLCCAADIKLELLNEFRVDASPDIT